MNTGDCMRNYFFFFCFKIFRFFINSLIFSIFLHYCHRYYEGGVASTYVWDKEDGGFALAFLMKKGSFLRKT